MATIYSVFANTRYNPGKVYIIATQVDTLNRPKENWAEQQKEWLKYLKGNGAYASLELAQKNLVPVSAYLYTLLKQYNDLNEEDDKYWDLDSIVRKFRIRDINENYKGLLDFTHIELLKSKIQREIIQDYKKLLLDDITGSYDCVRNLSKRRWKRSERRRRKLSAQVRVALRRLRKNRKNIMRNIRKQNRIKKNWII